MSSPRDGRQAQDHSKEHVDRVANPESAVARGPAPEIYCPECDYNLRGLTSERCPECGLLLAFLRESTSQIPWIHRADFGIVRSYWRTVFWVMFRRKRFAAEIARPVSYADSHGGPVLLPE